MLASGTGARIVTSHDDVCSIEFQVPASQDFKLAHKEIDQILKRAQVRPLAVGVHNDCQLLQFCYTSEVADSALKSSTKRDYLENCACVRGWRWWRWSGRVSPVTRCIATASGSDLKGQPVEFTWQSDDGISLVAVLRTGPTESLIQGLHQSVFRAETHRPGIVRQRQYRLSLAGTVRPRAEHAFGAYRL